MMMTRVKAGAEVEIENEGAEAEKRGEKRKIRELDQGAVAV